MRVKAVLMLSVLTGAFGLVSAGPAHACMAEFPSTGCVVHDVCMITKGKGPICR